MKDYNKYKEYYNKYSSNYQKEHYKQVGIKLKKKEKLLIDKIAKENNISIMDLIRKEIIYEFYPEAEWIGLEETYLNLKEGMITNEDF